VHLYGSPPPRIYRQAERGPLSIRACFIWLWLETFPVDAIVRNLLCQSEHLSEQVVSLHLLPLLYVQPQAPSSHEQPEPST